MTQMNVREFEPTDSTLDKEIESLIGKEVRGDLNPAEHLYLDRLILRRGRLMRPSACRGTPPPPWRQSR
ncbi:hypothetical protein SAMN05428984_0396 [Sphingomonas sp. OK281]|nr:hypothetical protein SAMN05428984_0396 [Sphingomonas sp. OK281]